jgi:hypothetical protein
MAPARSIRRTTTRRVMLTGTACALLLAGLVGPTTSARAVAFSLALGDANLTEVRTSRTVAKGVQQISIVRGSIPASPSAIGTTTKGPWRISVLSIDPKTAGGRIEATYGIDLARTASTSYLVQYAQAVAGVNASFFTFSKNPLYPGDPVGLGLYGGKLLSEPAANSAEVDFVINAKTKQALIGRLTWAGSMRNRSTDARLPLEYLNHPPVVPSRCAKLSDQTRCDYSGDVVHFSPQFGVITPAGFGVEVVLDRSGCPVKIGKKRGTRLAADQISLQATGKQTRTLLKITKSGCLSQSVKLYDEAKKSIPLGPDLYGVSGRYRLTKDGEIVVPSRTDGFFVRHPRTLVGTTADGQVLFVTIDGRQTTSVGTTLRETAAVALSLGMTDAVNLDGGGSTTMAVAGQVVNKPSGGTERSVGDALVYVNRP